MIPYWIKQFEFGTDTEKLNAVECMSSFLTLPGSVILDVLRKKINYEIEGTDVIVKVA